MRGKGYNGCAILTTVSSHRAQCENASIEKVGTIKHHQRLQRIICSIFYYYYYLCVVYGIQGISQKVCFYYCLSDLKPHW